MGREVCSPFIYALFPDWLWNICLKIGAKQKALRDWQIEQIRQIEVNLSIILYIIYFYN